MRKYKVSFILPTDIRTGRGTEQTALNYIKYGNTDKFDIVLAHTNDLNYRRMSDEVLEFVQKKATIVKFKSHSRKFKFMMKNAMAYFLFSLVREHIFKLFTRDVESREAIKEIEKSDIIYLFSNSYQSFFRMQGQIFVGSNHTAFPITNTSILRLEAFLTKYGIINRKIDSFHLFPVNKWLVKEFKRTRSFVLGSGVDTSIFYPRPSTRVGKTKFLFVGHLGTGKGIDKVLSAWLSIQDRDGMELHIAGGGELADYISHIGQRDVIYHGVVSDEMLSELYGMSDIFVYPSIADTFSLVVAQAFASGLHVLTTENISRNFLEFKDRGYLTTITTASDEIANAMKNIAYKTDEIRQECHLIHSVAKKSLEWSNIVDRLYSNFEDLLTR